ncbi:5-amino-6-(D-ribitylamino)uracil--L-tyrosine 4-hydroxyphenyl transferase CofH [Poseidonocella sedimentorum]|uniref:FO synthase n=1 Tax=Poseidonocella sedimentorum TaxID=871652 RepID=A0A1I6E3P1_9RHOB|nr:5-amino-6-(D-ribitylamino)uracil--L-tyrosine 4-hydroxyphenyl transferase CofH [Poseidonocella sedimentorum]SFR12390.1 FO synthase subunit 2 [Poseidonocella sedimentorum]
MQLNATDFDRRRTVALQARLEAATAPVRRILNRALAGREVREDEGVTLFRTRGADAEAVYATADTLRWRANGDRVSFVVNRNINFTNICYMGCRFCGFAKRTDEDGAEWLSVDQVVARAQEAWDRGGTEVCIQGGLHPKLPGSYYRDLILGIKAALPDMHIHAFSPFEIWYGASKSKMSYRDFLQDLKDCGLGSIPGTAAEILDTEVRQQLTKNKLSAERWVEIITTAHEVGIPTTATIMYGHVDGPEHWAAHIALLRDIQKKTGGFTELVPLSFVHTESPLYTEAPDRVRPGPTADEVSLMHAVSRIMLHGHIDNIQVSWTKLGAERAREMLSRGVNDLGGTLMNESISRAAGSKHGQEITPRELCELIRSAGRMPMRRNTVYGVVDVYDDHDPEELAPLVARQAGAPLDFLKMFPAADGDAAP